MTRQLSGISYQLTVQELFIVHCSLFTGFAEGSTQ